MISEHEFYTRVSGIDLPQPGGKVSARVKEVGCRLAEFAQLWEVPFEFNALADKWESITSAHLNLNQDEVLAVNCQYRLRNLLDESIMAASPRKLLLEKIRFMNPKVRILQFWSLALISSINFIYIYIYT